MGYSPLAMCYKMRLLPILASVVVLLPATASAADIISEVRDPSQSPAAENGGFLEIGLAAGLLSKAKAQNNPTDNGQFERIGGIAVSGGYRYQRFFAEATAFGLDGANLGATLWQNERWSVDFLALNISGDFTIPREDPEPPAEEIERDLAITNREIGFAAAGVRVTGYFGDTITQLRLVSDYYEAHGNIASARIGRQWLLGNWKMEGLVGLRYNSPNINQYLYGIDADETTSRFPEFQADGSVQLETQLGASYPISHDWVFRSEFLYIHYPNSIRRSPLLVNDRNIGLAIGLFYVF